MVCLLTPCAWVAARRAPLFGGGFGDAGTERSVVEVPVFWNARVAPFKAVERAALGDAEGFAARVWDEFCMGGMCDCPSVLRGNGKCVEVDFHTGGMIYGRWHPLGKGVSNKEMKGRN